MSYPYGQAHALGKLDNLGATNSNALGNPIISLLGAPNNPADMQHLASDGLDYRNFQEWKAYENQSLPFVRNLIVMQVFDSNTFYISEQYGLPVREMNETQISIQELEFDNVVIPDEPEEGIAPVIRSRVKEMKYQARRKGIAVELEHGWAHTDKGRRHFALQTKQVANSMLLTIFLDIIVTLLGCKLKQIKWEQEHGHLHEDPVRLVKKQASEAFILQKSKESAMGFLHKQNKLFKMRNNQNPNTVWVPAGTEPYLNGAENDRDLTVSESGEGAYARRMQDAFNFSGRFANLKVNVVDITDPDTTPFDMDPLVRRRLIGNFNHMKDHFSHLGAKYYENQYKSSNRDVYIYDMEADKFVKVTLEEAIKNCQLFNTDGSYKGGADTKMADMFPVELVTPNITEIYGDHPQQGDAATKGYILGSLINTSVQIEDATALHEENIKNMGEESNYVKVYEKIPVQEQKDSFAKHANTVEDAQSFNDSLKMAAKLTPKNKIFGQTIAEMSKPLEEKEVYVDDFDVYNVSDLAPDTNMRIINTNGNIVIKNTDDLNTGGDGDEEDLKNNVVDNEEDDVVVNKLIVEKLVQMALDNGFKVGKRGGFAGFNFFNKKSGSGGTSFWALTFNKKNLLARVKANQPIPFDFLLVRPFQEVTTGTGIVMKGGQETGMVLLGNKDAKSGIDVQSKIWTIHFTYNTKAIVMNPLNVLPVDDMFMIQYVEGRNSKFYKAGDVQDLVENNWEMQDYRPSIMSHIVPQGSKVPDVIDVRGKFKMDGNIFGENHFSNAQMFAESYGLNQLTDVPLWNTSHQNPNTVCFRDMTISFDPQSNKFSYKELNCGHFGRNVYEGMREDMENSRCLTDMHYVSGDAL